ncbi:MAG: condensation domain-containing protein, partial [Candidatus Sulfotelmatobacter sp.]
MEIATKADNSGFDSKRQLIWETLLREGSNFNVFPLSYAQERLWFLEQMGGVGVAYNMAGGVRLAGELKVEALEQALREVMRRHEVL